MARKPTTHDDPARLILKDESSRLKLNELYGKWHEAWAQFTNDPARGETPEARKKCEDAQAAFEHEAQKYRAG